MSQRSETSPPADVCLVVEGSYPYVTGGVASWLHQLISGLPEVRFSLVTLLADAESVSEDKYVLPPNVVERRNIFLFDGYEAARGGRGLDRDTADVLARMHEAPVEQRCPFFMAAEKLIRLKRFTPQALLTARGSWELVKQLYGRTERSVSFLDYFWNWRSIHGPMFRLMNTPLPRARVYHALSTGYAGFLAGLGKLRHDAGLAVTEHGLYVLEREIEIFNSSQIGAGLPEDQQAFFKAWWRGSFRFLGQISYDLADRIITLHEVNRQLQLFSGAPAQKLEIVPNGIEPDAYLAYRRPRDWADRPFRVALIGRVVSIKDVKTFLRGVQLASLEIPIEAYVLGPMEEEPEYARECRELASMLGIEKLVTFTGRVDVKAWLARLDLNVLTSVSESQPLVILEAAAAGVPSVASEVGCCRELLEGRTPEDVALGPSGIVTPAASPQATAQAIVALAKDPERHARMAGAGIQRVEHYYRQEQIYAYYRRLYAELARGQREPSGRAG